MEKLITKYRRYIIKLISTLTTDENIKDDLYQEATIALWSANENYDSTQGEFHPYAIILMKTAMLKYITNNSRTIRVPANKVFSTLKEGTSLQPTLSLDYAINDEETTLNDIIGNEDEDNTLDDHQLAIRSDLSKHLSQLKETHRNIIIARHIEGKTLEEIAKEMNITREAVRLQYERGMKQIRDMYGIEVDREKLKNKQYNRAKSRNAKGYTYNKTSKKWVASINYEGKLSYIGQFDTEEEAAAAYQNAKLIE